MNATDLPFLNPYLESVGAPNFQKGCNFAAGGATILPANAASTCPFSFGIQVAQLVRFKAQVLELLAKGISTILGTTECWNLGSGKWLYLVMDSVSNFLFVFTDKKLQKYLPSKESFRQALYMFDVGQNDLDGAFNSKSEDQVLAFIQILLTEFKTGVEVSYHLFAMIKFFSVKLSNNIIALFVFSCSSEIIQ